MQSIDTQLLLQQVEISDMFRPQKAAIIRMYVSENVKIKLCSCSHKYVFLCSFKCSAYRRAFSVYVTDLNCVCIICHFCTLGLSLYSVDYEPNATRQVCTKFN